MIIEATTDPDVLLWRDDPYPPRVIRRDKHPEFFLAIVIACLEKQSSPVFHGISERAE